MSVRQTVAAGVAASAAYLAEMALDMRLSGNRYDDLVLLGGFFTPRPRRQRLLGVVIHTCLGIALAGAYGVMRPVLPASPPWLQGLIFVQMEHLLTFPTVMVGDTIHPAVRRGQLPRLATPGYFWVETARHAAFGVVLGVVAARLEPRGSERGVSE